MALHGEGGGSPHGMEILKVRPGTFDALNQSVRSIKEIKLLQQKHIRPQNTAPKLGVGLGNRSLSLRKLLVTMVVSPIVI